MNAFLEELNNLSDMTTQSSIIEGFLAILLSFVLSLIITFVYQKTHKGARYAQSFIHTIIIMSIVVSIIMIVIGNNIAVAFGLVGAFSIIRFRSAMSDPKDIAFIFFGMAAGIASGLGFYLLAILFTITVSIIIYILHLSDYGGGQSVQKRMRVTIPENMHYEGVFEETFDRYLDHYTLTTVETTNLGTMYQLTYLITTKENVTDKEFIDAIRQLNANLKVSIGIANPDA
ncbi:putative membrane protein YhiD involved in acid resistance [Geomicrobium halophilum]|uniref:Putative membrane protein YhiD involved in acid resistance n=1 Tax=Geomicrobium halophilum TaxID=549000 RepID=A0A841PNR5_9BACL|nr:DUF4956 domain-containing protein [Geomicrobium halophilum]MBB6450399.1 putative membrane protein YhiD involved in acid resistance [Geomicrobium halophilum]